MQKYTIKPVLWKYEKNKECLYVIKLRVTIDRKQTYNITPYRVHESQWNKDKRLVVNHENANDINIAIRKAISELEKKFINQSLAGNKLTPIIIKGISRPSKNFFNYAREVRFDRTKINQLKRFSGEGLIIQDVTIEFLRKYETFLRIHYQQNTINSNLKYVHRIINQAKREKIIPEDPFDNYKIPRPVQTNRIYLVESEIKKLIGELDKPMNDSLKATLCYFLFG